MARRRRPSGAAPAQQGALALLDGSVRLQSLVMSFGDCFFVTGIFLLAAMPMLVLLGKPAKGVEVDMGH